MYTAKARQIERKREAGNLIRDACITSVSSCPPMALLGGDACNNDSRCHEKADYPGGQVQSVCKAWTSTVECRVFNVPVLVGNDTECGDLEYGV